MNSNELVTLYRRFGPVLFSHFLRRLGDENRAMKATRYAFEDMLVTKKQSVREVVQWIRELDTPGAVAQTDSVALARIAPADGDIGAVLARLGLPADLLGGSAQPGSLIATVGAAAPAAWQWCRGVPVVQCGFDAWCASYGMGAVQAGSVYNVCGTTDVFGGFVSAPVARQGIACLPWGQGLWHLGGPCLTGLSTLAWFGRQFLGNPDPAAVLACAATAGQDCPLALPFVHGERMPFWRPDLRAQWIGVHAGHGVPEFARALIDGLLLFQHWLIRQLDARPQARYLGGGGSTLVGWAVAKASAFDLPVRIPQDEEPALRGAAMCALTTRRRHASLAQSQAALRPAYREVAPEAALQKRMRALEPRLWPQFDALQAA